VTRSRTKALLASLDPARLAEERWFGGKGRRVEGIDLVDAVEAGEGALAVVEMRFPDAEPERYAMPAGSRLWGPLLQRLGAGPAGGFRFTSAPGAESLLGLGPATERPLRVDQSNSSFVLAEGVLVKCYRRLWPGVHPEVELVTYLSGRFDGVPRALGSLHYVDDSGDHAIALVQEYVPGAEDGWEWCQRLLAHAAVGARIEAGWAGDVGGLTAGLHRSLAGLGTREATPEDMARRRAQAESELERFAGAIGAAGTARAGAELARFESAGTLPVLARIHGDLHVGQLLRSPAGYRVIDFEGEPTRPLAERRALDSPLRDVASMLRSLDHVPLWVLREEPGRRDLAAAWSDACRAAFLAGYGGQLDHSLLRALEVEKAVYEFAYAAAFLPEWMPVARAGLEQLLAREVGR
jgi:maltokinase